MTTSKYRTHQGRTIDIGALILKNERTRAVGNMGVNARGDRIDADDRPIDSRKQQMDRKYRRQTTNVVDEPPQPQSSPVRTTAAPPATAEKPMSEPMPADAQSSGLSGAIARARAGQKGRQ